MPESSSAHSPPLRRDDLGANPLEQFGRWFEEARTASIPLAEAVALATATSDGRPSARMVLLKAFDESGFRFHTNFDSRKGVELADNPHAALLFHWQALGRQVRVEGTVERVDDAESRAYFRTRSREAQLSASASPQSLVVSSRDELESRVEARRREYDGGDVPLPPSWGGFVVRPTLYEFWQHRDNRLHDRFRYRPADGGWLIERLAP